MAQNRQNTEKGGLAARLGAEAAAIVAQRRAKKVLHDSAPVPVDSRPSKVTSIDNSLPRPSTPPIPAPRRINTRHPHALVRQPETTGKQPPKPLPRTVVKSGESLNQTPQSRPKVLRSSPRHLPRPQSQTVAPKQPPPPIAPKPALHRQLKQKADGSEDEESNRQRRRSSTLPQSWKTESQPYGNEAEDRGTSTATEDDHQHGMAKN